MNGSAPVRPRVHAAVRVERRPVHRVVTHPARPRGVPTTAVPMAGDVPDEYLTRPERMTMSATQRWLRDPRARRGADQLTDLGHDADRTDGPQLSDARYRDD